ncbi:MAG: Cytochrome-c3 hydrogenase, gamma subunit [Candidatus Syntrophoarchaeum caldarius]|uniref:Cytochrome-c3 hydrogenase, gamma subunit n=1 Tax=Candidatus Syntropharchaeum caldarium TaxID=1838285 RepID=A0A1F2PC38_9EURY|nr:MAG: Cytochrome-c3 hydrogenase, gamma subunit [Candidatus Syntrophoarchaeum caldarius]
MQIQIVRIERVVTENKSVRTFFFEGLHDPEPGNYIMVWIPGSGQIPIGISSFRNGLCGVTVRKVGETTAAMHNLSAGDSIGVTGPLGSSFSMKGNRILLVSGGIGIAPLLYLAIEAKATGKKVYATCGFENEDEIIFEDILNGLIDDLVITLGERTPIDLLPDLYEKQRFDYIYSCGPEPMMKRVFDFARLYHLGAEFSVERIIKCGMGICGACALPNGMRVCKDGPVFDLEDMEGVWR